MKTAYFFPFFHRSAFWAVVFVSIWGVSSLYADDETGPVFPEDMSLDMASMGLEEVDEPLPLPRPNRLLQRPKSRQVVYDSIDPVGSITPQSLLTEGDIDVQAAQIIQKKQTVSRSPRMIDTNSVGNDILYEEENEILSDKIIHDEIVSESAFDVESIESGSFFSGPIPMTFGMGTLDNLSLFSEVTTFKTQLSDGAGAFGLSEGINWSLPVTPQGSFSAQFGARSVQGELFAPSSRNQLFLTGGIFKRFDRFPVQVGAAVDWLSDRSLLGKVEMKQMRVEVSSCIRNSFEYGFMGGFDVFNDRPTTSGIDWLAGYYLEHLNGGAVVPHDYYLLFARKHLDSGGQVELRCGSTSRGDFIFHALGEVALSDRLAVNGGISMLAPSDARSDWSHQQESWAISLGAVFYFRGGAIHRQTNTYRPMFDVAGNSTFLPKIIGYP